MSEIERCCSRSSVTPRSIRLCNTYRCGANPVVSLKTCAKWKTDNPATLARVTSDTGWSRFRLDVVRDSTQTRRWKAIALLPHVKSRSPVRVQHMRCEGDAKRLSEEAAPWVSSLQLVAEREAEVRDERILGRTCGPRFEFARSSSAAGHGDERLGTKLQYKSLRRSSPAARRACQRERR